MSTILANNQPIEIGDQRFCVLVHQNGVRIKVPDALEVGITQTLAMCASLKQNEWAHISTGPLFTELFNLMFNNRDGDPALKTGHRNAVPIPKTVEELNDTDEGVRHISGMIIILVEASPLFNRGKIKHNRIYLNHPESFLHPAQERLIVSMLEELWQTCWGGSLTGKTPPLPPADQTVIEDGNAS